MFYSNPILHTSRLYSIFKDYLSVSSYEKIPLFYEDWDLKTSELLISMDKELFLLFSKLDSIGLNVKQIKPLLEHYESSNSVELTTKITSIKSLKGLTTPSIKNKDNRYEPDLNSRYFSADFPFGLDILIEFFNFLNVECPNAKKVSIWYHSIVNKKTQLFRNFFDSINDLIDFYR